MALVLGLNSGSSFDGIDVVVVNIEKGADGYPARPKFIGGNSYAWPDAVAEKVLHAFDNKLALFEQCRLNYLAGAVYAESARSLMRELSLEPEQLEVISDSTTTRFIRSRRSMPGWRTSGATKISSPAGSMGPMGAASK